MTSSPSSKRPPSKRFRFKAPHHTPRPLGKAQSTYQATYDSEARSRSPSPVSSRHSSTSTTPPEQGSTKESKESKEPKESNPSLADSESFSTALFESLSSSEAASSWAAIYGQPLHIYARPVIGTRPATDAEYASYVQQRVWENTREGVEEGVRTRKRVRAAEQRARARESDARRARERKAQKEDREREWEWARERRDREEGVWKDAAEAYVSAWNAGGMGMEIPWPWVGREGEDGEGIGFGADDIKRFLQRVADVQELSLEQQLRIERVRWHPDKIVQRFGADATASAVMERVNEVWRVVDALWKAAARKKKR